MAKKSTLVFGIIFLLLGILGFVPGNGIVGVDGTFQTDTMLNIVHLVFGLVLLYVAVKASHASAKTLVVVGVIYLILAIIGFIQGDRILGLVPVNSADNWLHLVLGVVIAGLGLAGRSSSSGMSEPSMPPQM